jgi:hypothetical protein
MNNSISNGVSKRVIKFENAAKAAGTENKAEWFRSQIVVMTEAGDYLGVMALGYILMPLTTKLDKKNLSYLVD